MQSDARRALAVKFKDLNVGDRFQLVNTVMNGAVPTSPVFEKIDAKQSRQLSNNKIVRCRIDSDIERV